MSPPPDPVGHGPRLDRYEIVRTAEEAPLNELGQVHTPMYLRWAEEVARAHADSVGVGAARMLAAGSIVVVRQHDLHVLRPAFPGDRLRVSTHVIEARGVRAVRDNRIVRAGTGELLVTCLTLWVWINPATGRPQRPPPEFMESYGFS